MYGSDRRASRLRNCLDDTCGPDKQNKKKMTKIDKKYSEIQVFQVYKFDVENEMCIAKKWLKIHRNS